MVLGFTVWPRSSHFNENVYKTIHNLLRFCKHHTHTMSSSKVISVYSMCSDRYKNISCNSAKLIDALKGCLLLSGLSVQHLACAELWRACCNLWLLPDLLSLVDLAYTVISSSTSSQPLRQGQPMNLTVMRTSAVLYLCFVSKCLFPNQIHGLFYVLKLLWLFHLIINLVIYMTNVYRKYFSIIHADSQLQSNN